MLPTSVTPQLFYRSEGKGPLVIMLHGLLMDGKSWEVNGLMSAFSPFFHVVCPDLAGHGKSEKFSDAKFYTQQSQILAIVKIMDELDYEKAHVIGYSAGAWVAMGLLNFYSNRLNSVVLGGWDFLNGLPETPEGKITFEMFISYARNIVPELTASLSSEDEKCAKYFFDELRKYSAKEECLFPYNIPTLLWAGTSDPYYASMAELAALHDIPMITGKGDHLSEINTPDKTSVTEIIKFITSPENYSSFINRASKSTTQ